MYVCICKFTDTLRNSGQMSLFENGVSCFWVLALCFGTFYGRSCWCPTPLVHWTQYSARLSFQIVFHQLSFGYIPSNLTSATWLTSSHKRFFLTRGRRALPDEDRGYCSNSRRCYCFSCPFKKEKTSQWDVCIPSHIKSVAKHYILLHREPCGSYSAEATARVWYQPPRQGMPDRPSCA